MKIFRKIRTFPQMNFFPRIQNGILANKTSEAGFFMGGANVIKNRSTYYYIGNKWADTDGFDGWVYYNKIYVASNSTALGNFNSGQVDIRPLRSQAWAANMVTNPNVIQWTDGLYYMFYTGTNYSSVTYPVINSVARANQQIGVAYSSDLINWIPYSGNPILSPRPGKWDRTIVSNPSVFVDINGTLRMVYESDYNGALGNIRVGVATATHPFGAWGGRADEPNFGLSGEAEDPYVWKENGIWYSLLKATDNSIVNANESILMYSNDGITWQNSGNVIGQDLRINWSNDTSVAYTHIDRPFVLVENGNATTLYNAVYDGVNSFNIARPLNTLI